MSFSTLPQEIRLQIYALVYHTLPPRVVAVSASRALRHPSPSPAPLTYNICREARAETRFQARQSNHLINVQPTLQDDQNENPVPVPAYYYEIIYRPNTDTLLITHENLWPKRPPWAPSHPSPNPFHPTDVTPNEDTPWQLFVQRSNAFLITHVALEISLSAMVRFGPCNEDILDLFAHLPRLRILTFVTQAFRCLSWDEGTEVMFFVHGIVGKVLSGRNRSANLSHVVRERGSRKREREDKDIVERLCIWRRGRLCEVETEELAKNQKMRLFVRHVPRFGKIMRGFAEAVEYPFRHRRLEDDEEGSGVQSSG